MKTIALISTLHEGPGGDSTTRTFRGDPVLAWTLWRLSRAKRLAGMAIVCWDDQAGRIDGLAAEGNARVWSMGARRAIAPLAALTAAGKWSDGWRSGLHSTCDADAGFHAPFALHIQRHMQADALLLVDASAGLIDAKLIDGLIDHAELHPAPEICFSQAAPGLSGVLLRRGLIEQLATAEAHPGRLLHYVPDQPVREPIAGEGCAPVATRVARTTLRFKLDSERQLRRMALATEPLNGQLMGTEAEELVCRADAEHRIDELPREVVLELTIRRKSRPIFSPLSKWIPSRPDISLDLASRLFDALARADDARLTLAGVGDPLCHPQWRMILQAARSAGIHAMHVETDLLCESEDEVRALAAADVDVVTVHLPANTAQTYANIMGVDAMGRVFENVRTFVAERQRLARGTPLLVPKFTKLRQNAAEMEAFYDQWLRMLNSAVIDGPSDFAGQIDRTSVIDMSPPLRRPCSRLASRMMVLCDGAVVSCENDYLARQPIGSIMTESLTDLWNAKMNPLRMDHAAMKLDVHPLCQSCSDWHRP